LPDPVPRPIQLGPERGYGPVEADFLDRLRAAAALCGVTRLADITGLDRLGLPVWQAVRPAGRSLSVHQGKGASARSARVGALAEAIEAHCAEMAIADGPLCRFDALPPAERAPEIGDFCRSRDTVPAPSEQVQWCAARDWRTGKPVFLPRDLVSLDYTRGLPSLFERVSGGLGAGPDEARALHIALLELVERDAVGDWQRGPSDRAATALRLDSIPFDWFGLWRDRCDALGIALEAFHLPSIVDVPAFFCRIGGAEEFGPAWRRFYGTAAHGDPEVALFKALAEAIQSRLTFVAGVRDDILPSAYARARPRSAAAPPTGNLAWDRIEPVAGGVAMLADRLAALGYAQVAVKRLDEGLTGVAVTKAFVPGLGSLTRRRRRPS
jgi:ribosomal protein S12 methylthiotransferase accessory factor